MTPAYKYRLPTKLPIKHRHPNALRNAVWAIVIVLAVYGLWYSVSAARAHYLLITEVEQRIAIAYADRDMLLEILRGKRPAMTEDGMEIAKVTWEEVKLVEGLK